MKDDRDSVDIIDKLRAEFQIKTLDPSTMTEVRVPFLQPSYLGSGKAHGGRLQAVLDPSAGRPRIAMELAEMADGETTLQADGHPMSIRFAPVQATPVRAAFGRGYVVFKSAHSEGGHMIRALTAQGVEDYVFFARKPTREALDYRLVLDDNVAGLRLVNNQLEALDQKGVPRLRVGAPQLIDSAGNVLNAALSLSDCVADRSLESPLGRPTLPTYGKACKVTASWEGQPVAYPVLVDPSWVSAGTMGINRVAGFTMTWLPNGNVLVAGGLVANTLVATETAELYIPSQNAWTAVAAMATPRMSHTATVMYNGKVLVAGGASGGLLTPAALASAEIFDPATGLWSSARELKIGATIYPRMMHTASLLPSGRVLIAGGQSSPLTAAKEAFVYDPGPNVWGPARSLAAARYGHTATITQTGTVLVVGGYSSSNSARGRAEIYNPTADSWANTTNAPLVARIGHAATLLPSGQVLVTGGAGTTGVTPFGVALTAPYKSAELWSPSTNQWTAVADLRTARHAHTATLLPDGTVLTIGGYGSTYLRETESYDPAANTWTSGAALSLGRSGHRSMVVPNGTFPDYIGNPVVLTAGGQNSNGTAEAYSTSTCGTYSLAFGDGSEGYFAPTVNTTLAAGLHQFAAINIPTGVTVTASGSGVLDLRSLGAATVIGTIDVSGSNGADGIEKGISYRFDPGGNGGGGATGNPNLPGTPAGFMSCPAAAGGGAGQPGSTPRSLSCTPGGSFGGGAGGAAVDDSSMPAVGAGGGGNAGGGGGGLPPWRQGEAEIRGGKGGGTNGGTAGATKGGQPGAAPKGPAGPRSAGYTGTAGGAPVLDMWGSSSGGSGGGGGTIGKTAAADLAMLATFQPGSGGGGGAGGGLIAGPNDAGDAGGGGGGGGGGAVRILSANKLTLTGSVRANGGSGGAAGWDYAAGGGGGSGGAIALVGRSLSILGSLSAVGGNGGAASSFMSVGGGNGGLGRIALTAYGVGSGGTCALTGTMNPPASTTDVACMTLAPASVCTGTEGACGYAYVRAGTAACTTTPLTLSGPASLAPGATGIYLTASGGTGTGYTYKILSKNVGTQLGVTTGSYTASSTVGASDILAVTDSGGNTASLTIAIKALSLTAASTSVPPRGSTTLTASGGGGAPYVFWFESTQSGAPSINPDSGAYVAGSASGTDVVLVKDAYGGIQGLGLTVTAGVSISEPPGGKHWVFPLSSTPLTATGGSNTGFTWSIGSTVSTIPPNGTISASGVYRAGPIGVFTDRITATDSLGNSAIYDISTYPAVIITPSSWSGAVREQTTFTASLGSGSGYTWSIKTNLSGGSITPTGGVYTAGSTKDVEDLIEVKDSLGATATATASVERLVKITPAFLSTYPSGPELRFTVSGGSGVGLAWSTVTDGSHGTLEADGTYHPGATGNTVDVLKVTDSVGNSAKVAINVGASVTISPSPVSPALSLPTAPRDTIQLTASGGGGGYTWQMLNKPSGGSVSTSGLYTAGTTGNVADIVQVRDTAGSTTAVLISVGPNISISPSGPTLPILGTQTFVAQGGKGAPYTWSLAAASGSSASITPSGVYTAGNKHNTIDKVQVTDSRSNTATIEVYVQ